VRIPSTIDRRRRDEAGMDVPSGEDTAATYDADDAAMFSERADLRWSSPPAPGGSRSRWPPPGWGVHPLLRRLADSAPV
jgi:hypothetical protein